LYGCAVAVVVVIFRQPAVNCSIIKILLFHLCALPRHRNNSFCPANSQDQYTIVSVAFLVLLSGCGYILSGIFFRFFTFGGVLDSRADCFGKVSDAKEMAFNDVYFVAGSQPAICGEDICMRLPRGLHPPFPACAV